MLEKTDAHKEEEQNDDRLLWTVNETATKLSVHPKTVSRLIEKGEIPFVKIGSGIRIEKQVVYHFIEANSQYNSGCVELVSSLTGENVCNSISETASIKCPTSRQVDTRLDALLKPVTKP